MRDVSDWPDELVELLPPRQMPPVQLGDERWYLPTWSERLRLLSWRNLLWLPLASLCAATVVFAARGRMPLLANLWWEVWIVLALITGNLAARQWAGALRFRRDPFCVRCGSSLAGPPGGALCPACGDATSALRYRDYQRDPYAFIEKWNDDKQDAARERDARGAGK